jgi:hypothetical protein
MNGARQAKVDRYSRLLREARSPRRELPDVSN